MSVTFLIPGFALLWGWLFLGEQPTGAMLAGCAVILLGTALTPFTSHSGRRAKFTGTPVLPSTGRRLRSKSEVAGM
jgi:hypothetical protein